MSIEKLFIELAKGATKEYTPFPINVMLTYLIDAVANQEERVSSLELKLEQHMIQPFYNAHTFLADALNASSKNTREDLVTQARNAFVLAWNTELPEYPFLPIYAAFYAGVCYDLLYESKIALTWYKRAHQKALGLFRPIIHLKWVSKGKKNKDKPLSKEEQHWGRAYWGDILKPDATGVSYVIPESYPHPLSLQEARNEIIQRLLSPTEAGVQIHGNRYAPGDYIPFPKHEVEREFFILVVSLTSLIASAEGYS